jgi:hypothetical protein
MSVDNKEELEKRIRLLERELAREQYKNVKRELNGDSKKKEKELEELEGLEIV